MDRAMKPELFVAAQETEKARPAQVRGTVKASCAEEPAIARELPNPDLATVRARSEGPPGTEKAHAVARQMEKVAPAPRAKGAQARKAVAASR